MEMHPVLQGSEKQGTRSLGPARQTQRRSSDQRLLRAHHTPGTELDMEDVKVGAQALPSQRLQSIGHSALVRAFLHFVDERENKAQQQR